jgi:hypothetical protein
MPSKSARFDVTIAPGAFKDIMTTKTLTDATFALRANGPAGVTQDPATGRIDVSSVAKLVFFFPAEYMPLDIMFAQTVGTSDDDGRSNLIGRVRRKNNRSVAVIDTLNNGGPQDPAKWKFFVSIQEVATSKIGIIDPEISNTDQD